MDSNNLAVIGTGIALLITVLGVWRDVKSDLRDLHIEVQALRDEVHKLEERLDERDHHGA